jgi:hypothetical protein
MDEILKQICAETNRAQDLYPQLNSSHEGYAVIREELDELWDLIKQAKHGRCTENMRYEAVQVAAMAVRFILDLSK